MLDIGPSLGCDDGDIACYCSNVDFGNGIVDCSNEACPNASDAQEVIVFGQQYCRSKYFNSSTILILATHGLQGALGGSGGTATGSGSGTATGTGTGASASGTGTGGAGGASGSGSSVPITTSPLTAVQTTDGSTITTTTGSTTIFGVVRPLTGTVTTDGSTLTTVTGSTTITGAGAGASATGEGEDESSSGKSARYSLLLTIC